MTDLQRRLCVLAAALGCAAVFPVAPDSATLPLDAVPTAESVLRTARALPGAIARFERVVTVAAPASVARGPL